MSEHPAPKLEWNISSLPLRRRSRNTTVRLMLALAALITVVAAILHTQL